MEIRRGEVNDLPELYKEQDEKTVVALDIGTRSIIGVVGTAENGRFHVLAVEKEEHGHRAMLDGQIEDIDQVARIAERVIQRLEARVKLRLRRVCVAAAGRALKSQSATFALELPAVQQVDDDLIGQLETGAVSAAEQAIVDLPEMAESRFYMVGYTVSQYRLDNYPMSKLRGHSGMRLEADVVATFLPREVVDSLYAVVKKIGLEVASLTLEPIASLNAAIPADIRLLNLVLVDIGAGTSDIAVCRDGSVVGYTMVTTAGDEVTETLMRQLLVDFHTAETIKMSQADPVPYEDILGLPNEISAAKLQELLQPAVHQLAQEIAERVMDVNGSEPSAVFLAGGGSKLNGLRQNVADCLGIDSKRVAIAGNHFEKSAFSEEYNLNDPELATPLGIAISAGLQLINDSYVIHLNDEPAKLFRSGVLLVRDILLMNGYKYGDLIGRTGANLVASMDGERLFVRGEPAQPPVLEVNGEPSQLSAVVHAGDSIRFVPAVAGKDAVPTLKDLLGFDFQGQLTVNGAPAELDDRIHTGDVILTGSSARHILTERAKERGTVPFELTPESPEKLQEEMMKAELMAGGVSELFAVSQTVPAASVATPKQVVPTAPVAAAPAEPEEMPEVSTTPDAPEENVPEQTAVQKEEAPASPLTVPIAPPAPGHVVHIILNGEPQTLSGKPDREFYYLMDALQYSGLDFEHLDRPVELQVNGQPGQFSQVLNQGDQVIIRCK